MNSPAVEAPAVTAGLRFALAATVVLGIAAGWASARADGAPQTGEWGATGGAQAPDLERWRLTRHGFGRLNVGLTRDKIERRAGRSLGFVYKTGPCAIWRIRGVRGIWIMTIRGRLARVDLGRRPWRTSLGIRVGDSASKVRDGYSRVRTRQHAYDPDGHYLIVPGRHRRVVFETNGEDQVTAIRGGRMPAVMYIEGCA
jgi:hypothetical protein